MTDTKHGWVTPRADGARARCGGPGVCDTCDTEAMHEQMLSGLFGAPAGTGAVPASGDTSFAGAAVRLSAMANEARKQYQAELVTGGEPTWPAWVDDLALLLRLAPAATAAPAAGDARLPLPAKMSEFEGAGDEYPSNESYQEGYTEGWNAAIDAALAAQVPQQGEA